MTPLFTITAPTFTACGDPRGDRTNRPSVRSRAGESSDAALRCPIRSANPSGKSVRSSESAETSKRRSVPSAATEPDDPTDASLSADAAARPRQRQERDAFTNAGNEQDADGSDPDDNGDEPAWAHHNQAGLAQLTPMLRHYVELKLSILSAFCSTASVTSSSASLRMLLSSHGFWSSPSPAKKGQSDGRAHGRHSHHAAERCADLIRRGYSVALCDQLETTPARVPCSNAASPACSPARCWKKACSAPAVTLAGRRGGGALHQ